MKKFILLIAGLGLIAGIIFFSWPESKQAEPRTRQSSGTTGIELPEPNINKKTGGSLPVTKALRQRRSIRQYKDLPLDLEELGQILWAAQGITHKQGFRTAPSAGALYPLEIYPVVEKIEGIPAGVYHYLPHKNKIKKIKAGKLLDQLSRAALGQPWVKTAPVTLVVGAVYKRTTQKYSEHGRRYVHIETGHAAQNVYLQAEALGLGTVDVGAFYASKVKKLLNLPEKVQPVLLMPLGRPAD